jgi:hypothetical protein
MKDPLMQKLRLGASKKLTKHSLNQTRLNAHLLLPTSSQNSKRFSQLKTELSILHIHIQQLLQERSVKYLLFLNLHLITWFIQILRYRACLLSIPSHCNCVGHQGFRIPWFAFGQKYNAIFDSSPVYRSP